MQSLSELPIDDFRRALTTNNLRVLQIIYAALGAGIVIFLAMIIFLAISYQTPAMMLAAGESLQTPFQAAPQAIAFMRMISILHGCVASVLYLLAYVVFQAQFGSHRLRNYATVAMLDSRGRTVTAPEEKALAVIRMALLVRLAFCEGAALVGLLTCLAGVSSGVLRAEPLYWLNVASAAIMLALVVFTFPTESRLERVFLRSVRKIHNA